MNVTSPIRVSLLSTQIEEAQLLIKEKAYETAIQRLTPIVKAMQLDNPRPEEIFALLTMADAQRFNGEPDNAYKNYVVASELAPKQFNPLDKRIFHCISEIRSPILSPTFEKHLTQYLHISGLDNTAVDQISINLIKQKFQLENDEAELEFSAIVADQFLTEAISHLILADPKVELFLTQLRSLVFTLAIETDLADDLHAIIIALANHAERVEYAFPIDDSERVVLLGIKALLETEIRHEDDLKQNIGSLLLYGMFEPISTLSCCDEMMVSDLEDWPEPLQALIKKTMIDRQQERSLGDAIPSIGSVTQLTSQAVMNQYEKNPYPRWDNIFINYKKVRYLEMYPGITASIHKRKKFDKHLDCLIAGPGTGRHPILLAANCRDISLTAVDLSLPSLSYAKRKSQELNVSNIEFYQGDILDLAVLNKKFDIIECSGVLHHMQDPEIGLKTLVRRLRSNGLLRLGLYSRLARERTGINEARVDNTEATLEDIRDARAYHLENSTELPHFARDFYTASECRDLLFHVQEHQYDIPEIKALLERHNLTFLGFSPLARELHTNFGNRFGPNADFLSLDDWHTFEQENPLIFRGMYQFHCQKRN